MEVTTASTTDGSLLRAVRTALQEADEALLAVAYVREGGVHLLRRQLESLGPRTRVIASTTFGSTTPTALEMARGLGAALKILNPGGGSYHPKAYLARRANGQVSAVIGSANLTSGLIGNVEVATAMVGTMDDQPLARAWEWAEQLWSDPRAEVWEPPANDLVQRPVFDPELLAQLRAEVARDPLFKTLTRGNPNWVTEVNPQGLYVETQASRGKGIGPQLIPAWMFELAWTALRSRGSITQQEVLATDGLNIKRSAGVCAILARLPGVHVVKTGQTTLRWEMAPEA